MVGPVRIEEEKTPVVVPEIVDKKKQEQGKRGKREKRKRNPNAKNRLYLLG